jgi:hypothetical protein
MTVGIANRISETPNLQLRQSALPAIFLAGSLELYAALRTVLLTIANGSPLDCLALDILTFSVAGAFVGIWHYEIPSLLRPLRRGIAGVVLVQVAFDGAALFFAPADMLTGAPVTFFGISSLIGVAAGILALWGTSFVLPLLFALRGVSPSTKPR